MAVCMLYPHAWVKYKFINRGEHTFSLDFAHRLLYEVNNMRELRLTDDEASWLKFYHPFLTPVFIDFLKGYRYNPQEVSISWEKDFGLQVTITGPWYRTILWEVKLMAIISELYFKTKPANLKESGLVAASKATRLREKSVTFAEGGTRRRHSLKNHDIVIANLAKFGYSNFVGTSNMYLAKKHDLRSIGTQAHEWYMFHAAKYGYKEANRVALENWVKVFDGNLGIALSDTFTTPTFLKSFSSKYAKLYDGTRNDSGNIFEYTTNIIRHYEKLRIDPLSKKIVFSNSMDTDKAVNISNYCKNQIGSSILMGTHFSNDVNVTPLNMVIKMSHCKPHGEDEWLPVVKLSDDEKKHTGTKDEIALCKQSLQIS
jgi:nicotinate phosphoribosyltransferase